MQWLPKHLPNLARQGVFRQVRSFQITPRPCVFPKKYRSDKNRPGFKQKLVVCRRQCRPLKSTSNCVSSWTTHTPQSRQTNNSHTTQLRSNSVHVLNFTNLSILPSQCAHQFLLVNPFSLPKAAFADKSTAYATPLHATSLHVSKLANLIEDDERRTTNDTLKTNQPTKRPTTNDQRPTNCLLFVRQFHPQLTPTPAPTPTHNPHTHSLTHSPQRTVHCSLYPGTVSTEYYHVVLVLAV